MARARSALPPAERANKIADKLMTMATDRIQSSWKELKGEFEVQKMVWDSLRLQRKVDTNKCRKLTHKINSVNHFNYIIVKNLKIQTI